MKTRELTDRALLGAIAGFCGTMLMSIAMQRLYEQLPREHRYPLTPREISDRMFGASRHRAVRALAAHFAYGALTGALFPLVSARGGSGAGALYGAGVWAASYLGWIPALRLLRPATHHPPLRTAIMFTAHLVWGAATALGLSELNRMRRGAFAHGRLKDSGTGARTG